MHENRHFLSYRKHHHGAENHMRICPLAFTTGWTSSGRLPFTGILFYFRNLSLFVSSYVKVKSLVHSSSID